MKNKYIDVIFMGILLTILFSLSFIGPQLIANMSTNSTKASSKLATFMNIDTNSKTIIEKDKKTLARESHEKYENLVDAMLTLRGKGFFTNDEILEIHKFLEDSEVNSTAELPYTDKDLLEYLYDNNMITKGQYEEILELMEDKD